MNIQRPRATENRYKYLLSIAQHNRIVKQRRVERTESCKKDTSNMSDQIWKFSRWHLNTVRTSSRVKNLMHFFNEQFLRSWSANTSNRYISHKLNMILIQVTQDISDISVQIFTLEYVYPKWRDIDLLTFIDISFSLITKSQLLSEYTFYFDDCPDTVQSSRILKIIDIISKMK